MTLLQSPVGSCGRRSAIFRRVGMVSQLLAVGLIAILLPACGLVGPALSVGLVKLQFGCLPEGTCIDTAEGPVPVEDIEAGDYVTGFGGQPVLVSQIHQYAEDPATSEHLTIRFANGSVVSASPRHRICGTPASMLKAGDSCDGVLVAAVERRAKVSRSFDLLTGDAGYRIGGIPVNSMIQEMLGR
jgi:hypothetical protein